LIPNSRCVEKQDQRANTVENNVGHDNHLDTDTEARVETLLARMTMAEKVGQLVQIRP
jgi:hypothetical protein